LSSVCRLLGRSGEPIGDRSVPFFAGDLFRRLPFVVLGFQVGAAFDEFFRDFDRAFVGGDVQRGFFFAVFRVNVRFFLD
jgi:hypothetical protein